MKALVWAGLAIGLLVIMYACLLVRSLWARPSGTSEMPQRADAGVLRTRRYLVRQSRALYPVSVIVALVVGGLVFLTVGEDQYPGGRAILTSVSFLLGVLLASLSNLIRFTIAVRSPRFTIVVDEHGRAYATVDAFRSNAAGGLFAVTLALIGVSGLFALCAVTGIAKSMQDAPSYIVGYGCGASFVSLFTQFGSGTAAYASTDDAILVTEVGGFVSASAVREAEVYGADVFGSVVAGIVGATVLGASVGKGAGDSLFVAFPLIVTAFGLLASMIGVAATRFRGSARDAPEVLSQGFLLVTALNALFLISVCYGVFHGITRIHADGSTYSIGAHWVYIAFAGCVGLAVCIAFVYLAPYVPPLFWRLAPVTVISCAIGGAFSLGTVVQVTENTLQDGVFGIAVATMGMLMSAGYVVVMGTFVPFIGSIGPPSEAGDQPENARDEVRALDRIGDATQGYAAGSATLVTLLLCFANLDQVAVLRGYTPGTDGWNATHRVDLAQPKVFIGALLGLLTVSLYGSWLIPAAHTARDLFAPAALVVLTPILVGVTLRAEGAAGFLIAATMGGILLTHVAHRASSMGNAAGERVEASGAAGTALPAPHVLVRFYGTLLLVLVPLCI